MAMDIEDKPASVDADVESLSHGEKTTQDVETQKAAEELNLPQKKQNEFNVRSSLVLAATSLTLFCTAGFINAFGVFQTYYTTTYLRQESDFQIAWIGSFQNFLFFGLGPLAGFLSDKGGPMLPIGIGSICQLVAIFMMSLCRKYYEFFLSQGVLLGVGMAFLTIPATSVIPLYFQRNRGLAQGFCIAGSSLGGVLWPIALNQLLDVDGVSFGWTLRTVGFIQIPLLAIAFVGVRRPRKVKQAVAKPTEPKAESKEVADATPKENKTGAMGPTKKDLSRLRHPSFVFLCAGLAIFYFGFFAPFFFVSTYALTLGDSQRFSIYLISILNAASLFGRTLPGFVADRLGHFNILVVSMFGSAIVCFCWTTVHSTAGLIVWVLAYGFISGAVLSLQLACASLVATKETMGTAFGILMASIALTVLFGSPINGELVKSGWLSVAGFAGGTMLAGAILVLFARLSRNRNLLTKA